MHTKNKVNRLYWSIHFLMNIYMRILCRLKIQGQEYIPPEGGLIVASNHVAGADPFLLGSTIDRELWFMAKKELLKPFILGRLLTKLNAFPVDRFGFDIDVIKKSILFLKQGKALIMFPEGTRSSDGRVMEGKIGVGMLACKAETPIVPAYIENTKRAWWNFLLGKKMKISFGRIIDSEWIKSCGKSKTGYKIVTDELMKRIRELQDNAQNT